MFTEGRRCSVKPFVDGREAVSFLSRIKETIEDPSRILLEV